jgi:peptidoglycan/xylan/chitin deacetylase (PgdA/CDA1 family)
VFRPGFLQKVGRTSVVQLYGVRTLLNGTLLPAPHIGRRHEAGLRAVRDAGFEIGIHAHNHYRWQDHVHTMSPAAVRAEFDLARTEFRRIFGTEAVTAGAAGWQANANSRDAYDRAGLLYASDTRGTAPFFPRIGGRTFATLEIPSTLPTLDELMGRPEFPDDRIVPHLLAQLRPGALNVFTLHAEIEGMGRRPLFNALLAAVRAADVAVVSLEAAAHDLLKRRAAIPVCALDQATVDGRSGLVAVQGALA